MCISLNFVDKLLEFGIVISY